NLKELFTDLKICLKQTFTFSAEQEISEALLKILFTKQHATRTTFTTMHMDVEAVLNKECTGMKLENVFGSPACKKQLTSIIKKTCSSV
ncbi:hypothetical protein L208DRAFT_1281607, partial [Tricholoma matsutake]